MKKVSVILGSLVSLLLFGPGCSKKNDSKPACKMTTATDVGGNGTTTYVMTYNADGKLATLQSTTGSNSTSKVFTYNADVILVTTSGDETSTDSIVINASNMIQSVLHRSGVSKSVTTYNYSGTQLQSVVSQYGDNTPTTTTFTYTNGDLTSSSDGEAFTYNTDKAASAGDYLGFAQLIQYGAVFVKTTHQIKSVQFGSSPVDTFTYTYDSNGNISALTSANGGDVETITFQYNCNN